MTLAHHDIGTALLGHLGTLSRGTEEDYLAGARSALERLVASSGLLDGATLARKPGGYARTLLFGDEDVSVLAMVWDVGARTPVHDHHCSCCFAVLTGELREIDFRAVGPSTALTVGEAVLTAGAVRCMMPTGPNLHQMVNRGTVEAVSIHVYGFDHRARASSVDREYRVLPQ